MPMPIARLRCVADNPAAAIAMMIALSPERETSMKMTWISAAAAGQSFVRVLSLSG